MSQNPLGEISGAAILQYVDHARHSSIDVDSVLANHKMNQVLLEDPETRITGEVFQEFLIDLVNASDNEIFGLQTSKFIQPGSYSVMGYIAMNSASISDAILKTMQYEKIVGDMGTTDLVPFNGEKLQVAWNCKYQHPIARRHLVDNVLASWVTYCRWMANSDLNPSAVHFEHSAPSDERLLKEYDKIFRCPLEFGQENSALIVTPEILAVSPRQPNEHILMTLEVHATESLSKLDNSSFTLRVREAIKNRIANGLPRKELIADEIGLNIRTLHRKLKEEGTSYQIILDELRSSLSMDLLSKTDLTQIDIASKVGFSDVRSFQHAFKKWAQMTPGDFRDTFRQKA